MSAEIKNNNRHRPNKYVGVRLYYHDQEDAKIIDFLDKCESKSEAIKKALREAMSESKER